MPCLTMHSFKASKLCIDIKNIKTISLFKELFPVFSLNLTTLVKAEFNLITYGIFIMSFLSLFFFFLQDVDLLTDILNLYVALHTLWRIIFDVLYQS